MPSEVRALIGRCNPYVAESSERHISDSPICLEVGVVHAMMFGQVVRPAAKTYAVASFAHDKRRPTTPIANGKLLWGGLQEPRTLSW